MRSDSVGTVRFGSGRGLLSCLWTIAAGLGAEKACPPVRQKKQDQPEAIDVTSRVQLCGLDLLGTHVPGSSHDDSFACQALSFARRVLGKPEIHDFNENHPP